MEREERNAPPALVVNCLKKGIVRFQLVVLRRHAATKLTAASFRLAIELPCDTKLCDFDTMERNIRGR